MTSDALYGNIFLGSKEACINITRMKPLGDDTSILADCAKHVAAQIALVQLQKAK